VGGGGGGGPPRFKEVKKRGGVLQGNNGTAQRARGQKFFGVSASGRINRRNLDGATIARIANADGGGDDLNR